MNVWRCRGTHHSHFVSRYWSAYGQILSRMKKKFLLGLRCHEQSKLIKAGCDMNSKDDMSRPLWPIRVLRLFFSICVFFFSFFASFVSFSSSLDVVRNSSTLSSRRKEHRGGKTSLKNVLDDRKTRRRGGEKIIVVQFEMKEKKRKKLVQLKKVEELGI